MLDVDDAEEDARVSARGDELVRSEGRRHFCGVCGSGLWMYSPEWPDLLHPFASAIDTPLPEPPERVHIMLDFKAPWVEVPATKTDHHFARYPDESIQEWHERHGLLTRWRAARPGRRGTRAAVKNGETTGHHGDNEVHGTFAALTDWTRSQCIPKSTS